MMVHIILQQVVPCKARLAFLFVFKALKKGHLIHRFNGLGKKMNFLCITNQDVSPSY